MKFRESTVDMDTLNAITDRVLRYSPPRKGNEGKKRAESDVKRPSVMPSSVSILEEFRKVCAKSYFAY